MTHRCPLAQSLGAAQLLGHRFRFAGPADVQRDRRCNVDGVLWNITTQCLAALDVLEGYPSYYSRKWASVEHRGQLCQALVYFMLPGHRNAAPNRYYFDMVLQGYQQHSVPTQQLYQNFNKSWIDSSYQHLTHIEQSRKMQTVEQ